MECPDPTQIFVEFRRKFGWDQGIPFDCVSIRAYKDDGRSIQLQNTDGTKAFRAGESFIDYDVYHLRVDVESIDVATSTAKVTINGAAFPPPVDHDHHFHPHE
jgi:hypothetical protein